MARRLYVGNLSYQATEADLRDLFAQAGSVASVKIITDAYTGQSRGFGFVEMTTDEDAAKAITALNGTSFMDRTITVNEARPKTERSGSGGRRDRGGYGGGGRSWR